MTIVPPRAEHGFVDDVQADRVLGAGSKSDANWPDPGKPVEIAPPGQCQFDVSVHPEKLMPGQTGTVRIVMILQGDSVMESAADLRIARPDPHGDTKSLLALGPATIRPPQPANLAAAYRSRQVYDNWAVVELPVTMSPAAPLGSLQSIEIDALFRLHEGSTGRRFGEYQSPLLIACEVGAVPDPAVRPTSTNARTATELTTEQQVSSPVESARTKTAQAPSVIASDRVSDPVRRAPLADLTPTPSSDGDLLLISVGGLLVFSTLALFLRRR